MPARIPESDLVMPALEEIYDAGGEIMTSDLIRQLENRFGPKGEDADILDHRSDTKFSQKVRNLKSHKTLEKLGLAGDIKNGFRITTKAREMVEAGRA